MKTILYFCSVNIALIIKLMETNNENLSKITFTDYFESLDVQSKMELRGKFTPLYVAYTTFYYKLRNNSFTELELQKLEELTNQTFAR